MDSRKSNAPFPMRAMTNSPKHIGRMRMNVTFPTGKECASSSMPLRSATARPSRDPAQTTWYSGASCRKYFMDARAG